MLTQALRRLNQQIIGRLTVTIYVTNVYLVKFPMEPRLTAVLLLTGKDFDKNNLSNEYTINLRF